MKRVGIIYHPRIAAAVTLAEQLPNILSSLAASTWTCSSSDRDRITEKIEGTDLILSIGGDGTILRVARALVPSETPILGVNLGHLGFMTELGIADFKERLPFVMKGEGWIERRAMLEVISPENADGKRVGEKDKSLYALNDIVVGRGAKSRVVYIDVKIDDSPLTTYKADGIILSTATGSTAYSLAAGGPILHPQSKELLLKPIAASHLTIDYALVLPHSVTVEMVVHTDHQAMLSIDGQLDYELHDGDKIRAKRSNYSAHFLRVNPPSSFYSSLVQRLKGRN